jgi:hypothetical protein
MLKDKIVRRRSYVVGLSLLFALLTTWASTFSASYEVCQQERGSAHPKQQYLGQQIAYFLVCEGVVLDDNAELVTALATLAVAGFTLTLWLSAKEQAVLTRKSIELGRQEFISTHRPRLKVRNIQVGDMPDGNTVFRVVIANAGETSAIVVGDWFSVLAHDGQEGVEASLREPSVTASENAAGDILLTSGGRHIFEYETKYPWNPDRDAVVILTGYVSYLDEGGELGAKRMTGFARDYDIYRGSLSISKIYAHAEFED